LVADYFTACPRCSYFVAGYRLIQKDFDQAAQESSGDWLALTWSGSVSKLVHKSYGYETDDLQALQGVCPDCRRAFIYEASEEAGDDATGDRFSLQINPRS
jgi:hypothetical protein